MILGNTYIAAVERVQRDKLSTPTDPAAFGVYGTVIPSVDVVAEAANAALTRAEVDPSKLGPVLHFADPYTADVDANYAVDLLRAANLPPNRHPLITMSGSRQGVLDALTTASCYLDRFQGTAGCALITASGIWPVQRVGRATPPQTAGAALVLSDQTGTLELLATATMADPELMTLLHAGGGDPSIRDRTAALLEQVVVEALHDAEVERDQLDRVITPYEATSEAHRTLVCQIGACTDTLTPSTDSDVYTLQANALDMITRLASLHHESPPRPYGSFILVVADGHFGTATAAVLRVV